ncbi:MAG: peptidylprolyl isomerase [Bryobacteraceae bacterium]|nr:peptidylprolyl isomerase [Bryobacteraceae bacterium]
MLTRLIVSLGLLCLAAPAQDTIVRFRTNLGDIDVQMLPAAAPLSVANFLGYVRRGDYNNTIFHRSVNNFVVQGGGFNTSRGAINSGSSVRLEYREANTRGTLAMARGDSINSATNQWFFNTVDNTRTLGPTNNGGYTVFGRIVNTAGLGVMDRIAAVPIYNFGAPFDTLPLQNYRSGTPTVSNYIVVNSVAVLEASSIVPTINEGGAVTVSSFGGFSVASPGSWIEIYGTNLATTTREWAGGDFTDGQAPFALDEVSVTIGGQRAFVRFVSPGQLNVQVPANVPTGGPQAVVVTARGVSSPAMMLDIQRLAPGLFAPPAFKIRNAQFVVPVRPSDGALINNGSVPGVRPSDAIPGETLLFYGVGFGRVDPATVPVAGQVVTGTPRLVAPVTFRIGDQPATVTYAGLVSGAIGLYQFNVVIPPTLTRGDVKVEVEVDGIPLRQETLYLPVANPPAP